MSDLANLLRITAKEMAEHDEPPSWQQPIVEAADEIEKLRAALQSARRDALEEAAQVADDYALKMNNRSELVSPLYAHIKREFEGRSWVAQTIAAAIRALGEKE